MAADNILFISFEDFEKMSKDSRVYYYEDQETFDFHYIVDGTIVKSRMQKENIENYERFFSKPLFYGAIRLEFNITSFNDTVFKVNRPANMRKLEIARHESYKEVKEEDTIEKVQEIEIRQEDIQEEEVDEQTSGDK